MVKKDTSFHINNIKFNSARIQCILKKNKLTFFVHTIIHSLYKLVLPILVFQLLSTEAIAHGGVFLEEDVCVIQIDFYQAHFTIYQPQISQHDELCEDIPEIGETIFVMEYLHDGLREMPVDFRIIKDTQKLGRFAKLEDVKKINNINAVTAYYQPPTVGEDGIYLAKYDFIEEGYYIGVVTAQRIGDKKSHTAVFPFKVGKNYWGYIPLIIALAIFLQLNYWLMNGGFTRLRKMFTS